VAKVNDSTPTPDSARAALAEVDRRASEVDREGSQYRLILLAIAALYIGAGVVVGFYPRGGSVIASVALLVLFGCAIFISLAVFWQVRAYSRASTRRFVIACVVFTFWSAAVTGVSSSTGWWGPHQPGTHFTVSAAVSSIPFLVAAWLLGRRRA
jgi:hypothetical protein